MTHQISEFSIGCHMHVQDCLTWETVEQTFCEAFAREMTPDEHQWFYAIWSITYGHKQEASKTAAA